MFTFAKSLHRLALVSVFVAAVVASTVAAQESHGPQRSTVPQQQGNLHVLSIGIGKYAEPGNDLFWMDRDAKDHDAFWRSLEGRLWSHVDPRCLINKEATGAKMRENMEDIKRQAQKGATVILDAAGHGCPVGQTEWKFCTYDDDNISADYFRQWAKDLSDKGVRVIMIFDSCFSGRMVVKMDELKIPNVLVLASSGVNETSLDIDFVLLHGNSLFTKVLLEALSGKADANGDGIITAGELIAYLIQHVPELAELHKSAQNPRASFGGLSPETPLIQLKAPTPVVRMAP